MTRISLNKDQLIGATGLLEEETVLRLKAQNYTPLLLGGFDGRTWTSIEGGDGIVTGSLSRAIVGRARWLLRVLVAHVYGLPNHRCAERYPSTTLQLGRETMRLGLVQLVFGSASPAWSALYRVQAIPLRAPRYRSDAERGLDRGSTRVALIMRGSRDERGLQPVKAEVFDVEVRVLRRPIRGLPDRDLLGRLDSLVAWLVAAVLRVFGVGGASNRGFGRFRLSLQSGPEKLRGLLEKLEEADNEEEAKSALEQFLDYPVSLLRGLPGFEGPRSDECRGSRVIPGAPRVVGVVSARTGSIVEALELIGRAVSKSCWKNIAQGTNRVPGGDYHTWVLGLPRSSLINYDKNCTIPPPDIRDEKIVTGYLLEKPTAHETPEILAEAAGWAWQGLIEAPEGARVVYRTGGKSSGEAVLRLYRGRRQSPFTVFPLKHEDGSALIAVLLMHPYDMEELLDSIYHSGGLLAFYKENGRKKPHHHPTVRLAKVTRIAERGVGVTKASCLSNRAYQGPYKNKGARGVRTPQGSSTVARSRLLEEALGAAEEFILEALRRGRC